MSSPSTTAPSPFPHAPALGAATLLLVGAWSLGEAYGPRLGALLLIGAGLGFALYHAAFGFTRAWREFVLERRSRGICAQMVLLSLTVLVFFPALAAGELLGRPVWGFVVPAGTSVAVGAFIFGVGMQLGGGCASGTLFAVGGGNTRMLLTLAAFVAGSFIATAHMPFWYQLPHLPAWSAVREWGAAPALGIHLAAFFAIALGARWLERRHRGSPTTGAFAPTVGPWQSWYRGPWSLTFGAVALAVLSVAVLYTAGHPWGITSAFALWGAKIALASGVDVTTWPYWEGRQGALARSVFQHPVSVMNFGIVLGALLAAGLANRFAPSWRISPRQATAALVGGLMLGYGARLASGCNIGAYFSGIASGSLHGWLWLVAGFAGSVVGTRLRPLAGFKD